MSNLSSSSPQYGLALDTTGANLSIALSNFVDDQRVQTWHLGRDLSSQLHLHLHNILKPQTWSDLKFIAVAKGPGSFTSIRIGIVTARTLGQQLQIPVYGISNLVAIAALIAIDFPENQLIAIQMKTRREQVFVGIYRFNRSGKLTVHLEDSTMNLKPWLDYLNQLDQPYELYRIDNDNDVIIDSILEIGKLRYQQDSKHYYPKQPHPRQPHPRQPQVKKQKLLGNWTKVTPYYGQNPFS